MTPQKAGSLHISKNIKLPMGNQIIAKSIKNSDQKQQKIREQPPIFSDTPQDGTLRPLSSENNPKSPKIIN